MAPLDVTKLPTVPSTPAPNAGPASNDSVSGPPLPAAEPSHAPPSHAPPVFATGKGAAFASSLPSVTLPKAGGAIRNIDEKFQVNRNSGTCALTIPISVSKARTEAATPSLSLSYNSGSGNGAFGLGWGISVPTITRKTDRGIPRYSQHDENDGEDDVFVFSSSEDLVPRMTKGSASDNTLVIDEVVRDAYLVRYYLPRIEGSFFRIERCTNLQVSNDVHWRVITAANHTHIFGRDDASRIGDGEGRIFSWLLSDSYDSYGNTIEYSYKSEDSVNVPLLASEANRSRSANRYLKTIKYGNRIPNRDGNWSVVDTPLPVDTWMFEIVFDYGEHNAVPDNTAAVGNWACRQDPFSTYRAGFEIRTCRLCRRILMLHHFPEQLGQSTVLVGSTTFQYEETPVASLLTNVSGLRYSLEQGSYASLRTPGLTFRYTHAPPADALFVQEAATLLELPASEYQWIDLDSEGLPGVLSEQAGSWFYRRNLSANNIIDSPTGPLAAPLFGPLEQVASRPAPSLTAATTHLTDLAGTGEVDLVDGSDGVRGYYTRTSSHGWSNFSPFDSWPNIDLRQPNVQYIDLTGDGIADIMVTEDNAISWFQSLGRAGYARARHAFHGTNEGKGPKLVFTDPSQSIYLADFSGDGLLDLVRVRNGDISYWPNLGYARFGEKITMDNAPFFDASDLFSHDRLRLADLDGSGTTDLVYLPSRGGVDMYRNQAGNAWSPAARLDGFPRMDSIADVRTVDLLGTGCTCLVWTRPLVAGGHGMRYIDLMNGVKPLLLQSYRSDVGVERKLAYVPSTRFYLDARDSGTPWITRLQFPVQCVSRVEVFDHVSRSYSATRYAYHHGFYDATDREFRGFGMVEEWDAAEGTSFPGAANLEQAYLMPAARSKTWFHAGAYRTTTLDRKAPNAVTVSHQYVPEYFRGEAMLEDSPLLLGLTGTDYQQASRSLKGMILREESYIDDGTPLSLVPFHVAENNYTITALQPSKTGTPANHAVFYVTAREHVTATHERDPDDAQVTHTLNLSSDAYGNVLKSVSVTYGRKISMSPLSGAARATQERSQVIYSENAYTNAIDTHTAHINPLLHRTRKYHLTGLAPVGDRFSFAQFAADGFAVLNAVEVPFEQDAEVPEPRKRLIAGSDARYRRNDLTGMLDAGIVQSLALPCESYQLALTPGLLDVVQGRMGAETIAGLAVEGGYVEIDQHLWIPSGRHGFDISATKDAASELAEARAHFFTAKTFTTPFGDVTLLKHDSYDLLPIEVIDPLLNKISVSNSYIHLAPVLITDPNGNRAQIVQNPRGEVVGTATMGKVGSGGDSLDGFNWAVSKQQETQFLTSPNGPIALTLLGNATTRTVIVDNFSPTTTTPSLRATIERENHVGSTPIQPRWKILLKFAYHDGLGRQMQVKTTAEDVPVTPGGPSGMRWIGSGWKIWNNKGLKATQYEPFFDTTHAFQNDAKHGIRAITSFYDHLGRPVCLLSGDNTWTKVIYQTWQTTTYDASDVAEIDPLTDQDVGHFFRALKDAFSETWYSARKRNSADPFEKVAGLKTATQSNTPVVTHHDPQGRAFVHVEQNGPGAGDFYTTRSEFDVMGNARKGIDAKNREVIRTTFDMRGQVLHRSTMDFGQEWFLCDVFGQPLRRCQDQNIEIRTAYDALRRPVGQYSRSGPGSNPEILFQKLVYGEPLVGQPNLDAVRQNLCGRLHQIFDQSGVVTNQYDFKGNLIRTDKQVLRDYRTGTVDWGRKPALEPEVFTKRTTFDALNRVLEFTNPDFSITKTLYDRASRPFVVATISPPATAGISPQPVYVITGTEYNAMGQITLRSHGNGTTTKYTYDPLNFLPRRIQTIRAASAVQDLNYTYDARGNITHIMDTAQPDISSQNASVTSTKEYTYDPINRLIESTGRENQDRHGTTIGGKGAARQYTEQYSYDSTGNILSIQHSTPRSPSTSWTRRYFYEERSTLEKQYFSNRLSRTEIGRDTEKYLYDTHGNIISMAGFSQMTWDFLNQLRTTSKDGTTKADPPKTTHYTYDSHAQRVRKVTEWKPLPKAPPTRLCETVYCGGYEVYRKYRDDGTRLDTERKTVSVRNEKQICRVETEYSGTSNFGPRPIHRYQLSDHLESVMIESDDRGSTVSYEEFSAYGSTTYQLLVNPLKTRTAYRFSGKEKDVETGLYYFGARYYAPGLGRWVSPDPIGTGDGPNVYCYVNCNPISFRDPDGRARAFPGVNSPEHAQWRTDREAHLPAPSPLLSPFDQDQADRYEKYHYHATQLQTILNHNRQIYTATLPDGPSKPGFTPVNTSQDQFESFVVPPNKLKQLTGTDLMRSIRHGYEAFQGREAWDLNDGYRSRADHWGQKNMTATLTISLIDRYLQTPRDEEDARDWERVRDTLRGQVNTAVNVYRSTGGRNYGQVPLAPGIQHPTIQSVAAEAAARAIAAAAKAAKFQARNLAQGRPTAAAQNPARANRPVPRK